MRLIHCHIENFGRLQNLDLDFAQDIWELCRENGWGKSTLAAFLQCMFYGLKGDRKRSLEENDRRRYAPWQGGIFGGSLTFEAEGRTYTVTRIFGERESKDIYELVDAETNLPSRHYTARLGQEIFGIDREAFLRTIFIRQNQCTTAANGDIHTKISHMTEEVHDMKGYEEAVARLNREIASLNPHRVTGSLSRRQEEMLRLQRCVDGGAGIDQRLAAMQNRLALEQERYTELTESRREAQTLQARVAELQRSIVCREEREHLRLSLAQQREETERCRKVFPGAVPPLNEVEELLGLCGPMERAMERFRNYELSDELSLELMKNRERFLEGVPSEAELRECSEEWKKAERARREEERRRHAGDAPVERSRKNPEKKMGMAFGIPGICLLLMGILLLIFDHVGMGLGLLLAGGILLRTGVSYRKREKRFEDIETEQTGHGNTESDHAESDRDSAESNPVEPLWVETSARIGALLRRYGFDVEEEDYPDALYRLRSDVTRYLQLLNQEQVSRKARTEYEDYRRRIKTALAAYGIDVQEPDQRTLLRVRDRVDDYLDAMQLLQKAEGQLADFEEENRKELISADLPEMQLPSLEEANANLQEILEEMDQCREHIRSYGQVLEELQQEYDDREENQELLRQLQEVQEKEEKRYQLLVKARDGLTAAREEMIAKYADPVCRAFKTYYGIVTGGTEEQYRVDANLEIRRREEGLWREIETLSAGYQDLVGLCMRIALVDAMYEKEKPMLILDDPFVNLDDDKIQGVKKLFRELTKDYQILYFTCSNSRKLW